MNSEIKGPAEPASLWLAALNRDAAVKKSTSITGDEKNVLFALRHAPELAGLVAFDELALCVRFTRDPPWRSIESATTWTDHDDVELAAWLQNQEIAVRARNVVTDCVALVARDRCVHPIRDYLAGLKWDGAERVAYWLENYLGAEGDPSYLSAVGRCWLISAIARVNEPGCQADHVLVLEGVQGLGKSRTARVLAVKRDWFADSVGDLGNKDAALQLSGKWILELSELAAIRRGEIEQIKGFISRPADTYRPPYGRRAVTVPRQSVFIGTSNELQYLRDRTGNRRFWPARCTSIRLDELVRDRDQLWAEALQLYRDGQQWHLDTELAALALEAQSERVLQTELEAAVSEYLERLTDNGIREVSSRAVFINALRLDPDSDKYAEQTTRLAAQVAAAIESAGWHRTKVVGRGKTKRRIYTCAG